MDHEFLVTLKPAAANANGRRLDTTEEGSSTISGNLHADSSTVSREHLDRLAPACLGGTSSRFLGLWVGHLKSRTGSDTLILGVSQPVSN